jgi:hypothetical protein
MSTLFCNENNKGGSVDTFYGPIDTGEGDVIWALKRQITELKRHQGAVPLSEAMICLTCGSVVRLGRSCCGDLSLLSGWLSGLDLVRHDQL